MNGMAGYFRKNILVICLIIAVALSIRLCFFVCYEPWDSTVVSDTVLIKDAGEYHELASSILRERSFDAFNTFFFLRPPGYPVIIAAVYLIAGNLPWAAMIANIILDILTMFVAYLAAIELFGSTRLARIVALLYAVSFWSSLFVTMLLSEIPFTLVFMFSIYVFIKALKTNRLLLYCTAGLLLGVSALIRPVTLFFPVVFVVVILFQKRRLRSRLSSAVVVLLVFMAVLSPWQLRNLRVFGNYALTNIGGINLCRDCVATVKADEEDSSLDKARRDLEGHAFEGIDHPFEREELYRDIAVSYILDHKGLWLKAWFKGSVRMFMATPTGNIFETLHLEPANNRENGLSTYSIAARIKARFQQAHEEYFLVPVLGVKLIIEYLLFCIGLFFMLRNRQYLFASLFVLTILYFTGLQGVYANARFKIPIIPLYLIISARGLDGLLSIWKEKRSIS